MAPLETATICSKTASIGSEALTIGSEAASSGSNIDQFLPQPVENDTITKELSRLRGNINNHTQAYYDLQAGKLAVDKSNLAALSADSSISASALAALFVTPSTRSDAIRLYIAWAILSHFSASSQPTLLPPELASVANEVSSSGGRDPGKTFESVTIRRS